MKCLSVDIYICICDSTCSFLLLLLLSFFFLSSFSFFLTHDFVVVDNVERRELVNVYGYSAV